MLLSDVSFAWPGMPVLDHVSAAFDDGWTGVVGANGAGKTTLLRLLAGELRPDHGAISGTGWLCRQEVVRDAAVEAFAGDWDGAAARWRSRLGLDPEDLDRWDVLSPGHRKRWQIGAALAARPPVLLLDEPTNHLDAEGREVLLGALRRHRGVGVVVSHDRTLLDSLTTRTVRVEQGALDVFPGPASAERAHRDAERQARLQALDAHGRKVRAMEAHLERARRQADAAARARRVRAPRHDHDARSMGRKVVAGWAEARASRDVAVARDALHRTEAPDVPDKELGRSLFVGYEPAPKRVLARLCGDLLAGGRPILRDVALELRRDDRVRVAGANGAGKTTLLQGLLGVLAIPEDKVLHVPQEVDVPALLDRVQALPAADRGRTFQVLAALGVDPARVIATPRPSPGEARKLAIAEGLGRRAWVVVLDEPTNHLDLPSIERLEEALVAWPGALVLVTHDEHLARACTRETWHVADGRAG